MAGWSMPRAFDIPDEAAMEALGARLAAVLADGTVVFLRGELGAGKTTLVRGILRGLGHDGAVKSPTYTLVEPYRVAGRTVYHFDLYRLNDPEELEFLGVRDYLSGSGICLIEWPERGAGVLAGADLEIGIERTPDGRRVRLQAHTPRGTAALHEMT
jgi:tRNA threonylcarbamoyladenosine biosynthesis protein TsaE